MNTPCEPDHDLEERLSRRLLDIFIRAGLVLALVLLCYHIFSPFLTMMLWALILSITIYPLHQMLAVAVLVLGVAQLPALLVTLPVIGWIWASGDYATVLAAAYSVLLFVGGMADNVLKRSCSAAASMRQCR